MKLFARRAAAFFVAVTMIWVSFAHAGSMSLLGVGKAPSVGGGATTTWDGVNKSANITRSGGNLVATNTGNGGGWGSILTSTSKSSGKYYGEIVVTAISATEEDHYLLGFAQTTINVSSFLWSTGDAGAVRGTSSVAGGSSGAVTFNSANVPSYTAAAGDKIGFAIDFTAGKAWVSYNNTFGGSPAAGTNPAFTWTPGGSWFLGVSFDNMLAAEVATLQLTSGSQSFSPPSGFSTWD